MAWAATRTSEAAVAKAIPVTEAAALIAVAGIPLAAGATAPMWSVVPTRATVRAAPARFAATTGGAVAPAGSTSVAVVRRRSSHGIHPSKAPAARPTNALRAAWWRPSRRLCPAVSYSPTSWLVHDHWRWSAGLRQVPRAPLSRAGTDQDDLGESGMRWSN